MRNHQKTRPEEPTGKLGLTTGLPPCKAEAVVACRAEDIGLETFLLCLEKDPENCEFSVCFGNAFFCKCSLHTSIAKTLKGRIPRAADPS